MSKRTRESQIKTIRQIQSQIKTYIRWKECGTIAKYFKKTDLLNHIYSIRIIFTLTNENKISSKVSKLEHVLRIILKREYNTEPNCLPLPYLRLKDGKEPVPTNSPISTQRRNTGRQGDQVPTKTMDQHVQKVPTNRRKIVQVEQVEGKDQSTSTGRNRSDNIPLPQRSDSRALRIGQDARKDKAPISLAKNARRNKTVHRIMPRLSDARQTEKKQRAQPYLTNRTLGKSRN